jgi:phospholipase D-like protein
MIDALHSNRELFVLLFLILGGGLWLYTLLNVLRAQAFQHGNKPMWLLLLLLAPGIGVLIYLAVGRPRKA